MHNIDLHLGKGLKQITAHKNLQLIVINGFSIPPSLYLTCQNVRACPLRITSFCFILLKLNILNNFQIKRSEVLNEKNSISNLCTVSSYSIYKL